MATYRSSELFSICLNHSTKATLRKWLKSISGLPSELHCPASASLDTLRNACKKLSTENQETIMQTFPEDFHITATEIPTLFHREIKRNQVEFLARHGKLHVMEPLVIHGHTYDAYNPEDVCVLSQEDWNCPDVPSKLSFPRLRSMGWTETMVKTLLPEPMLVDNPVYKCADPMRLWDAADVEAVMESDQWAKLKDVAQRRSEAAKKAATTRRAKLSLDVDKKIEQIQVEVMPIDQVRENAIQSRQDWYDWTEQWDCYADDAPADVVMRWMVNYIRHHLTQYDDALFDIKGKVGIRHAYVRYRNAVLDKIAETYPECAKECRRQRY